MRIFLSFLLTITFFAVSACGQKPADDSATSTGISADTVYTNGRIYTVNEAAPWAEAVAIKDGRFIAVGSDEDVSAATGYGTEIIDLGGKFAMPGIVAAIRSWLLMELPLSPLGSPTAGTHRATTETPSTNTPNIVLPKPVILLPPQAV